MDAAVDSVAQQYDISYHFYQRTDTVVDSVDSSVEAVVIPYLNLH